jgi:hypothetical protein
MRLTHPLPHDLVGGFARGFGRGFGRGRSRGNRYACALLVVFRSMKYEVSAERTHRITCAAIDSVIGSSPHSAAMS